MEMQRARAAHVDLVKCLAMLFVVMYHGTLYSYDFLTAPTALHYLRYALRAFLSAGVPLFFTVNGYLLLSRPADFKKHALKTVRLAVITVIWGAILLFVLMLGTGERMSAIEFFKALWNWRTDWIGPLWFMGALVCIYVVFPLLKLAFDGRRKLFAYFTLVIFILTFGNRFLDMLLTLGLGVMDIRLEVDINLFNMFNPLRVLPGYALAYFCLGGLLFAVEPQLMARKNARTNAGAAIGLVLSAALLALWGVFVSGLWTFAWDVVWSGYDTVFTLLITVFIYFLCLGFRGSDTIFSRGVRLVSSNTLGIYFLHMIPVVLSVNTIMRVPLFQSVWANIVYALLITAACTGVSLLIKRIPVLRRLLL